MLFEPAPYKVMYGGRGASKTWDFCRALLILGSHRKLFILCAREIQKSIAESVHRTLHTQAEAMGLDDRYETQDARIINRVNGTELVFAGLRNHVQAIKSMEGIDICAVFEATFVSQHSWEVLLPTIRRDAPYGPFGQGSEVWVEFNPELTTDYTYQHWVVDPPPGAVVVEVNWRDNPWFPETLQRQKEAMRVKDHDSYMTVWEGRTRRTLQGAIYAKELAAAIEDGRVDPGIVAMRNKPVIVSFDLGRADMTSMWFLQQFGTSHYAIDFYENCGFDFSHYLEEIQGRKYVVKGVWLPHDARQKHVSAKKSVEGQAREAYPTPGVVRIVPNIADHLQINRLRALFPRLSFNEIACNQGIQALTHYQYGVNDKGQRTKLPLHNWASHASKSLQYYAVQLSDGNEAEKEADVRQAYEHDGSSAQSQSWMGH